jgi:hypothetical protein
MARLNRRPIVTRARADDAAVAAAVFWVTPSPDVLLGLPRPRSGRFRRNPALSGYLREFGDVYLGEFGGIYLVEFGG